MKPLILLAASLFFASQTKAASVTFARDFAPSESWTKPVEKPLRDDICLNGSWQFQPAEVPRDYKRNTGTPPPLNAPILNGWDATKIKIPSPWNVNTWGAGRESGEGSAHPYWPSSLYYPSYPARWDGVEMAWLRRSFRVPNNWTNRHLILHFEAVAGQAQIFINGQKAGKHFGSHLPFEIDVTNFVNLNADNQILVGVRGAHLFDEVSVKYPKMRSSYPPGSNTDNLRGIWQDVFLLGVPPVRIDDVFVKPQVDQDTLEVEIAVHNDSAQTQNFSIKGDVQAWQNLAGENVLDAPEPQWSLGASAMNFAPQNITVPAGQSVKFTLTQKVNGRLKFWSPDTPNLYGLVLSLNDGNNAVDQRFTRFGWRQVKIVGKDVLLNGQKIQMYGDLLHPFGPFINSRRYVWAWYRIIKDMHGNAVRPHAQPHPRAYLDLADEMGLFVLDETALFGSSVKINFDSPVAWPRFEKHFDDLILRDRNHPSVFGWSFGNELFAIFNLNNVGQEQSDEWYKKLAELGNRARNLDPTRDWISCDGDEDLRGTLPVWNRHFGHGLPDTLPDINKPLMIGESGGSYYARPSQLSVFNGERAYENYAGRNEALAIDVYQNIVQVARPKLSFYSPAETAWFGIEHLPFGYSDFTRLPNANDGVWFKPFEEDKAGVQIERLPPYVTTLNPAWDAALPLYKPLAMFEAQKAAQASNAPQMSAWDHFAPQTLTTPPLIKPNVENVAFIGAENGILQSHLRDFGVPLNNAAPSKLLIIEAQTLTKATLPPVKQAMDAMLANNGTVWVFAGQNMPPFLSEILPAPVIFTTRNATALVPREKSSLTASLALPDLYFAEDLADKNILKSGLDGDFVRRGRVLLAASNTDWALFNNQPENAKCAALVLYEHLVKPNGAALVEMPSGNGHVLLSTIEMTFGSDKNTALWRRLFANLGVKLSEAVAAQDLKNAAFNRDGALIRALALALPSDAPEKAIATDIIGERAVQPKDNTAQNGATWKALEALDQDRYNFDQFHLEIKSATAYFSFWISSPTELSDPLIAGPDAPKVGLRFYAADTLKLFVNGEVLTPDSSEAADYRKLLTFTRLPLKKGWNHLLIKVSAANISGAQQGTLAARLFCDHPQFLEQLKTSVAPDSNKP